MGMENRPPGGEETALMRRLLEEALAAGALGLSSGLFTPPGSFATSDELIALGQILRPYGASYATHLRDEASGLFDAVREAVRFGEACGVHVQLVHLKLSGVDNWGQADQLLAEIEAARAGGIRIDADHYPYTAAGNPLRNLLPTWVQDGGLVAMLRRLAEPSTRDRIRQQIAADGLNSFGRISSWDAVSVANSPRQPDTVGQTIAGVARARGCDPIDALCDNLIADGGGGYVLITSVSEEDVREFLRSPTMLVGSDGRAVAPDSVTGQGKPHPRFYGTFPRVLGHYVRDLGLLPLPQAIFKMTGGSARALGLADRGFVREGYQADLTVFEPGSIADRATYDEPQRFPAGIANVMVNGVVVVDEGEHTGALPGQVLRRRADGSVR
jgi:N-acyl-D-amino-acid deacylase